MYRAVIGPVSAAAVAINQQELEQVNCALQIGAPALRTHGFYFARLRCERSERVILCCVFYGAQLLIKEKLKVTLVELIKAETTLPPTTPVYCYRSKFIRAVFRIDVQYRDNEP